jgi:hypothetical protein
MPVPRLVFVRDVADSYFAKQVETGRFVEPLIKLWRQRINRNCATPDSQFETAVKQT